MPNPLADPNIQPHYERKQRIAMARMAQATGLDPKPWASLDEVRIDPGKYDREDASSWTHMWSQIALRLSAANLLLLWNEISRHIAAGVPDSSAPIPNDPFATFVTGICADGHPEHRQTAVIKTGARVDQVEGERQIAYLKAQENVKTCEICGNEITTWQSDHTRMNTFKARPENQQLVMPSVAVRGPYQT